MIRDERPQQANKIPPEKYQKGGEPKQIRETNITFMFNTFDSFNKFCQILFSC